MKQTDPRSGRRYRKMRADFLARARMVNAPCWLAAYNRCLLDAAPIDWHTSGRSPSSPELDHFHPASTHPHLVYEPSNFRVAHARCNQARGAKSVGTPRHPRLKDAVPQRNWTPASW